MSWYFLCLVLSLFALVTGQSDNAYLALLALFAALPFYMFRSRTGVRRYLVILASFFSVIQLIEIYILKIPGEALGKRPVRVWGMFVMLCLALLIFVLFDANIAGHGARYGPLSSYVVIAVLFAVLCYGAQAFVNINLPIAAPVMWTLLMLGAAGCRDRETDAAHRA